MDAISYTYKKSTRAKRMRLAVYCDGRVVVTVPAGTKQSIVDKFVSDKEHWVLSKLEFYASIDDKKIITFSDEDYLKNKDKALLLAKERIDFYNKIYNFSFNKIFIKNQKTRWGSCSQKGNLNLNYKILFLPEKLRDYIIVHELCHLQEMNHSPKFWSLVARALPHYKDIKTELRKHELLYR